MSSRPQVMIDLETMSTRSWASIASIGAVKFGTSGTVIDTFYVKVDVESCKKVGLHVCKDVVAWWSTQNRQALLELMKDPLPVNAALTQFSDWFGPKSLEVWGNGSDFDNAILANAYAHCNMRAPWKYADNRCYRTMKNLIKVPEPEREGVHHNALDDAMFQMRHLVMILNS